MLFFLSLVCIGKAMRAQYIYTIKADSVKITNTCDTAELIIENHTQNVCGFLFNKGRGRTEFRRGLIRINDSISIIGCDTLKMNPWLQGGNRFATTGVFGTMDNNHVDFYTNSLQRARLTNNGVLQIGNMLPDNGDKLQVSKNGAVTVSGNLSRSSDRVQIGQYLNSEDGQNALIRTSNDNGLTYKNVLVERDGYIGLGTSNKVGGWNVGNPALRLYSNGVVNVASNFFMFGYPYGNFNSSSLMTYVSNLNEWDHSGNYPNRQNYYYFGTQLGGANGENVRASLKISGRELNFLTGAVETEAMRIAESQNVIIGVANDNGNKLQLVGNFYQGGGSASFGNGLLFNQLNSQSRIYSEKGIIYQSNSTADQHLFSNQIGAAFTGTLVTIDPGYYQQLPDNQLSLNVYGKQYQPGLAVNMAGRVGIGTQTPTAQLHTTGSVRFGGLSNNNGLTRFIVSDANGNLYYREDTGSAFNGFHNSDLAINGRLSAKQMLITQTGRWPDYVFSKQYQLPSLTEVENFINQHSHLPGIPSAAEVEKKGIDVGNNQAALLKKIEELTLYIIEQDKTIKKQNDQYTELKHEMTELKALIKSK
ncbi:hypothetical protein A4R26_25700 [Niastella populi]|uniref:Peptidase S74 domain-containing protein n=2 Tax=Niastella populi TaxID=550983 RepID=A0A1V9FEB9_9BACT|nr:hypothetical protein A4R26_25700 [Niastella populi]